MVENNNNNNNNITKKETEEKSKRHSPQRIYFVCAPILLFQLLACAFFKTSFSMPLSPTQFSLIIFYGPVFKSSEERKMEIVNRNRCFVHFRSKKILMKMKAPVLNFDDVDVKIVCTFPNKSCISSKLLYERVENLTKN